MTFKIKYHFVSDEGILREIKWLGKSKDTPKHELYEWQWLKYGEKNKKLEVVQCKDCIRVFTNGSLNFDSHTGHLKIDDGVYELKREK